MTQRLVRVPVWPTSRVTGMLRFVSSDIAAVLERELGAAAIVGPADSSFDDYCHDESPLPQRYPPECAVKCATTEQVAAVLRICAERRVPVTPRGAGSGMCGGSLAIAGGVVLSTETMGRIVEVNSDDLVAVVEPGVVTGRLAEAADDAGMFYPPDPASLDYCSIGGNASTNSGGPRAFKYGVTREYVLGLEVVLMGGEVLRVGRRTAKGVTGYDLTAGFVGSEGTFGVITELTMKLLPKPQGAATVLAIFADVLAAGVCISSLLQRGLRPSVLEIADRSSIDHIRGTSRYRFPAEAGAFVLIELDGDNDALELQVERLALACDELGAIDVMMAQGADRAALWDARRQISASLKAAHRIKVNEDLCVPRGSIVEMLRRVELVSAAHKLPIAVFGHAGDGNLHVNILSDEDPDDPAARAKVMAAASELFVHTIELRGTLSGEHGIGLSKRDYMPLEQTPAVLQWQRRWKAMWDPAGLLNPGKVLPGVTRACTE